MSKFYWVYADITGEKTWHLVEDKKPGLHFIQADFIEDYYDIIDYQIDFPDNTVLEVPNPHQIMHPLGICDDHMRSWDRLECPLCDFLFVYDRMNLAIEQISLALFELETEDIKKAQKRLKNFMDYCRIGNNCRCTCDDVGESRCGKHGLEILADRCRPTGV